MWPTLKSSGSLLGAVKATEVMPPLARPSKPATVIGLKNVWPKLSSTVSTAKRLLPAASGIEKSLVEQRIGNLPNDLRCPYCGKAMGNQSNLKTHLEWGNCPMRRGGEPGGGKGGGAQSAF